MTERHLLTITEETTNRSVEAVVTTRMSMTARISRAVRISEIFRSPEVTDYYKSIFNSCDTNKDGQISLKELKDFLMLHENVQIPDHVVRSIQRRFDRNHDEQLNFEEFLEMLHHPTIKRTFKNLASRYLKFVTKGTEPKTLILRRTITNTGQYEDQYKLGFHNTGLLVVTIIQLVFYYIDIRLDSAGKDRKILKALEFHPRKMYQIWRYFTYALCHKNLVHLISNVIFQLVIGFPLEIVHSWRVLLIFVAGSIGGCLIHSVVDKNTKLYGASGGVYSFFTAHIASVIMNWREMSHPMVRLLIFGIWLIFDICLNYYIYMNNGNVSYADHLGGAVVGLLLGVNILRNLRVTKKEMIVRKIFLIALVIFISVLVTLNFQQAIDT